MKLVSFSYDDEIGKLEGLNMQSVNLIVGRNASGKSQTLYHIEATTDLLSEKKAYTWQGSWRIEFETENRELLTYSIERNHDAITNEKLILGSTVLIDRKETKCIVYSTTSSKSQKFTPPKLISMLGIRSDSAVVYREEALQLINLPLRVTDDKKGNYTITSYQVLYRRRGVTETEDMSGKTSPTTTTVISNFKTTPLSPIWIKTLTEQLRIGEELYFFDIVAKDAQGRLMFAPDLRIKVK